jgi:hypothetical protein
VFFPVRPEQFPFCPLRVLFFPLLVSVWCVCAPPAICFAVPYFFV